MDGFHRPNAELVAMGRLDAKGAPDTFDAEGYAALLRRLHAGGDGAGAVVRPRAARPVPDTIEVPAGRRAGGDRGQLPAARRAALARRAPRVRRGLAPGHRRVDARGAAGPAPPRLGRSRRSRPAPGWPGSTRPTPISSRPPRRADVVLDLSAWLGGAPAQSSSSGFRILTPRSSDPVARSSVHSSSQPASRAAVTIRASHTESWCRTESAIARSHQLRVGADDRESTQRLDHLGGSLLGQSGPQLAGEHDVELEQHLGADDELVVRPGPGLRAPCAACPACPRRGRRRGCWCRGRP